MTCERMNLMKSLMAVRFYLWDLHLYLDTHPCDKTAMELHERYMLKEKELKEEYECKFGPLTHSAATGEEWIKAPWPWQRMCDC